MADDPYLKRGLELEKTGSSPPAPTPTAPAPALTAAPDPYVQRGIELEAAPPLQVAPAQSDAPAPGDAPGMTVRGTAREVAGALPRVGANVINLLSDPFANLVGYPLTVAGQTAYDFFAPMLGGKRLTDAQRNALYEDFANQPGERVIRKVGETVGANPYDIKGTTPAEQQVGRVVEGAGTAGALAPAAIPGLIAGAGGQLGGEIAASYVPDWLKPSANLVGNVAGAKTANVATNVGTRAVNAATGERTPVAAAYDELGIKRTLLGDVSESPTLQLAQSYGSKSPFGSSVVAPKEREVVGQFGQAVENTAQRLGTSTSEQTAGEVLQREARNWKDVTFPQRQAQAWQPVDAMLGSEQVAPANYRTALTSLTGKLAALPETQKALVPQKAWDLLEAIDKDVPAGGAMPWRQAQDLRTALGKVMGIPEIVQSVGKDQLKNAYGGISQDMRDTAARVDAANAAATAAGGPVMPSAVDAFTNANKVSTDGHAFIEGPLSKIVRSNNPAQETIAPERATKSVLGSGDTTLEALRREMPKAVDELAGYKLRDMALATPGAAGRTGTETSVGAFLTDLNRLRQQSPAGYRALFADPDVARKIDAMATVADSIKETAKRANTSGTGPYVAIGELGGSALGTYLATQSPLYAGLALAAPLAANKGIAHTVTSPTLTNLASAPGPRNPANPLITGALLQQLEQERQRKDKNALARP